LPFRVIELGIGEISSDRQAALECRLGFAKQVLRQRDLTPGRCSNAIGMGRASGSEMKIRLCCELKST
jgi:hypothetical protein